MKKTVATVVTLIMILSANLICLAQESPTAYMELSTTGAWKIFTKNMQDKDLLKAVDKSAEEINEILGSTGSESVIINKETGAQIYLKVKKNDLSYELWNISDSDNAYITENLKKIVYDGFSMESFNYQDEDVAINDYAYMKFITIPGSAYINSNVHGVVCGGTIVNGSAIVFTMIAENYTPTAEEIKALDDIAQGVSFTVIKEKSDDILVDGEQKESDVFTYILGGFGALVLIIFCVYMIVRMKSSDEEKEIENEKIEQE